VGTSGLLKKTAANTWALDTSAYLTGNQSITYSGDVSGSGTTAVTLTIGANKVTLGQMAQVATGTFLGRTTAATGNVEALTTAQAKTLLGLTGTNSGDQTITLTGDVTGSGTGSFATTLATVATAGTYKSVTVDAKGRVTAGTNPTTLSGYGITDAQPLDGDLTSIAGLAGTSGLLAKTAANTWSLDTNAYITGNQSITFSGDATGSGATSVTLTLANSGVTAGTYKSVTVDAKGRVTGGTNPTTLAGYGITDAYTKTEVDTAIGGVGSAFKYAQITTTFYTLTSTTAAQKIFNTGTLTVDATGIYAVDMLVELTSMSSTSGNLSAIDLKGAGTATIVRGRLTVSGYDANSAPSALSGSSSAGTGGASTSVPVTAGIGTGLVVQITGYVDISATGTLIPSLNLATAAAANVSAQSYITLRKIAETGAYTKGTWA
jgi:phage-related tail fiber protein